MHSSLLWVQCVPYTKTCVVSTVKTALALHFHVQALDSIGIKQERLVTFDMERKKTVLEAKLGRPTNAVNHTHEKYSVAKMRPLSAMTDSLWSSVGCKPSGHVQNLIQHVVD